jgi:hypothetical protein
VTTRDALRNGSSDERKILRPEFRSRALNVKVAKENVQRALNLLACIVECAEANDAKVIVSQSDRGTTSSFVTFGQSVEFSMSESARQRFLENPPVQAGRGYVYVRTIQGKPIEYVPSGQLTLEIQTYRGHLRRIWKDGKHSLESLFPEIMNTFFKAAVLDRRESIKRAEEEDHRRRKQMELAELRPKVEEEDRRVRALEQEAENWKKAKTIREYVLAVVGAKKEAGDEIGPNTPTGIWIVWALQQADRLDPLVKSPPSILDRKKELEAADRMRTWSPEWR